ncbi:MAG TPA: hypothetical protein VHG69_13745 [Thermoleophilaceae bacterium]|nr:hypothetical protein [Thermoleophilaceae bacterium]
MARRFAILALVLAAAALVPGAAQAASLSYIGADGNAYLASPDGARTVQLTRDANADTTYKMAGQTNAGTVVVARRAGGDTWFHWLNRDGSNKSGPWLAPEGNLGTGPLTSHVAPEGGFVVFYASNCTFACQSQFFRVCSCRRARWQASATSTATTATCSRAGSPGPPTPEWSTAA